ncbi:MAG: AAA family ATPase [Bacteroidota bacterium]
MRYWLWAAQPRHFATFSQTGTFGVRRQGRPALYRMHPGDRVIAVVSQGGGLAGLFEVVGEPFEDATSLLLDKPTPHRVRVRRLAELPRDDWVPIAPLLGDLSVLQDYPQFDTAAERFAAVARQIVHELPAVDGKVLEFTVHARQAAPLGPILEFVGRFVRPPAARPELAARSQGVRDVQGGYRVARFDRLAAIESVIAHVKSSGFVFAPYEVASALTALRTKPFLLLAGPTGVGKTALPRLLASATGARHTMVPVQPDWTDAGDTLGYVDLSGRFRPGVLLRAAQRAHDDSHRQHVIVLDEMNVARPEQYLTSVLSHLEEGKSKALGYASHPLLDSDGVPEPWASVPLPSNLSVVGTVNIDESTVPFSRKVLDRAFVLEFGTTALHAWEPSHARIEPGAPWPATAWRPRARSLAALTDLTPNERRLVSRTTKTLTEADRLLRPAGFAVGYRTRDEVALFVLHASESPDAFRMDDDTDIGASDLALMAKLLPRLAGGSRAFGEALHGLLGWAVAANPKSDTTALLDAFARAGRPARFEEARFPFTAARLARMALEWADEGYASFWT